VAVRPVAGRCYCIDQNESARYTVVRIIYYFETIQNKRPLFEVNCVVG